MKVFREDRIVGAVDAICEHDNASSRSYGPQSLRRPVQSLVKVRPTANPFITFERPVAFRIPILDHLNLRPKGGEQHAVIGPLVL